jgi:hypothetical protein
VQLERPERLAVSSELLGLVPECSVRLRALEWPVPAKLGQLVV